MAPLYLKIIIKKITPPKTSKHKKNPPNQKNLERILVPLCRVLPKPYLEYYITVFIKVNSCWSRGIQITQITVGKRAWLVGGYRN